MDQSTINLRRVCAVFRNAKDQELENIFGTSNMYLLFDKYKTVEDLIKAIDAYFSDTEEYNKKVVELMTKIGEQCSTTEHSIGFIPKSCPICGSDVGYTYGGPMAMRVHCTNESCSFRVMS